MILDFPRCTEESGAMALLSLVPWDLLERYGLNSRCAEITARQADWFKLYSREVQELISLMYSKIIAHYWSRITIKQISGTQECC
jgi:hypothetical protein